MKLSNKKYKVGQLVKLNCYGSLIYWTVDVDGMCDDFSGETEISPSQIGLVVKRLERLNSIEHYLVLFGTIRIKMGSDFMEAV